MTGAHTTKPRVRGSVQPSQVDFARVNRAALAVIPWLLDRWLPGGRAEGTEYVALNPRRRDQRPGSFRINMRTPVVIAGVLDQVMITHRLRRMSYCRAMRWAGADPDKLSWVAKACGYKCGWVWHQLREQARTEP
jgi:hypothetical protein